MRQIFGDFQTGRTGAGLLILRLAFGVGILLHGLPKLTGAGGPMAWMGPHAPVPGFLQALAVLAEVGGGLALIVGLLTPLASLGILCNMLFAIFMVHLPKGQNFELAGVYLAAVVMLLLTGPGAYSLDALLFGNKATRGSDERLRNTRPAVV